MMPPQLFSRNQKVITDISDNEWTGTPGARLPKRGEIYHVAEYKADGDHWLIRLREMGQAWYLERGFKAYRSLRRNVV